MLKNQFEKLLEKIKSKSTYLDNLENLQKEKQNVEIQLKKQEDMAIRLFV
jgi:hypothetical protein